MLTWLLESIIRGDPHVKSAVMFDRGRLNLGVIIDPKPEFSFDPEDQEKLADFRNKIWCVDRACRVTNRSPRSKNIIYLGVFFRRVTRLTMASAGQLLKR